MMINTIGALQGLYVALGGDLTDVANITTIPEMLTAISTVAAAAASELPPVSGTDDGSVLTVVSGKWAKAALPKELPTVTEDDNKKVLTVVNGAWNKADAPGELFVVNVIDGDDDYVTDKSLSDIRAALAAGKTVILNQQSNTCLCPKITYMPLIGCDDARAYFGMFIVGDGDVTLHSFKVYSEYVNYEYVTVS